MAWDLEPSGIVLLLLCSQVADKESKVLEETSSTNCISINSRRMLKSSVNVRR